MGDEEVSKLRHELSQKKKSIELLQASNLDQRDEIRALKCQARSYEDAITNQKKKVEMLLGLLRNSEKLYEEEVAALTQKVQTLEEGKNEARSCEEEIIALTQKVQLLEAGNDARSYEEEITALTQKVQLLERGKKIEARSYEEEITALTRKVQLLERGRNEAPSYREEVIVLTQKVQLLERGKLEARSYREEVIALTQKVQLLEGGKTEARSYEERIIALTQKVQAGVQVLEGMKNGARSSHEEMITTLTERVQKLEEEAAEAAPACIVGREVRLRYLENYRKRNKRPIGEHGHDRIRIGNRAAHRGRPVVDALLCLDGEIRYRNVYLDLYGISPEMMKNWKDVSEMRDVTGFRASLQTERRLTPEFKEHFECLVELATEFKSSSELNGAFAEKEVLRQLHSKVQFCYDRIVEANPWIKNPPNYGNCGSGRVEL